jgi:hypothetical protein
MVDFGKIDHFLWCFLAKNIDEISFPPKIANTQLLQILLIFALFWHFRDPKERA